MWHSKDVPALEELALLRDRLLDGKHSVAAEVRLRSDAFGLTPKGRKQLRWLILDEVEAPDEARDQLAEHRRKAERRRGVEKLEP
jgi:hypothetical protein